MSFSSESFFRLVLTISVPLVFVVPVLLPVLALIRAPNAFAAWAEAERILNLVGTTLALAVGAVLVAVPLGTLAAIALERGSIPGRRLVRLLFLASLFVPLPVLAVAWQVILGSWLPPLQLAPGEVAWRPWSEGVLPAAWVHGIAGVPWVVWIVSGVLRTSDRTLEETAMLEGGTRAVFCHVLLPRVNGAAVLAAAWVAVLTTTEIAITDAMMVRTFAEEVYTQLVTTADGLPAAVAVTIPAWVAAGLLVTAVFRWLGPTLWLPSPDLGPPVEVRGSTPWKIIESVGAAVVVMLVLGGPVVALFWKVGGGGSGGGGSGWSLTFAMNEMTKVARTDGAILFGNFLTTIATGLATALLAWLAVVLATRSRCWSSFLLTLCVLLLVTPAPIVGLGLKQAIFPLLDLEDAIFAMLGTTPTFPPLRSAFYDQPSPAPAIWAAMLRFFPVGVLVIWPSVRAIPRELTELAQMEGNGLLGQWRLVTIPLTQAAFGRAVIAVTALSLGEIGASKLVNPPARPSFILRLFDQMHYGADSTVAALCLLQLAATVILGGMMLWLFAPIVQEHGGPISRSTAS